MKKRILSLLLCLVLAVSLAAPAAAEFTDEAHINSGYLRAVRYLTDLGVINGFSADDGTNTFEPENNLTRAEASKILAYIVTGGDTASLEGYYKSHKGTLKDVADSWASDFIAYCVDKNIVAGMGNGLFDPGGSLTGCQAAKMLLGALGYNASGKLFTGADWDRQVSVVGEELGLFEGISKDVDLNKPVSREVFCHMAYTAMTRLALVGKTSSGSQGGGGGDGVQIAAAGIKPLATDTYDATFALYMSGIGFKTKSALDGNLLWSEAYPVLAFLAGHDGADKVTPDKNMSVRDVEKAILNALGMAFDEAGKGAEAVGLYTGLAIENKTRFITVAEFSKMAGNALNYVFPNGEPWGASLVKATDSSLADAFGYNGEFSGTISETQLKNGVTTSVLAGRLTKDLASFGDAVETSQKTLELTAVGAFGLDVNGADFRMDLYKAPAGAGALKDSSGAGYILSTEAREQITAAPVSADTLKNADMAKTVDVYRDGKFFENRNSYEARQLVREGGVISGIEDADGNIKVLNTSSATYAWCEILNNGTQNQNITFTTNEGVVFKLGSGYDCYDYLYNLVPDSGDAYGGFYTYTVQSGRLKTLSPIQPFSASVKSLGASSLVTEDNVEYQYAKPIRLDGKTVSNISSFNPSKIHAITVDPRTNEVVDIITRESDYTPVYIDTVDSNGKAKVYSLTGETLPDMSKLTLTASDEGRYGYISSISGVAVRFTMSADGSAIMEARKGEQVEVPKGTTIYTLSPDRTIVTQKRSEDGYFLANSFFRTLVFSKSGEVKSLFVVQPTEPRIGVFTGSVTTSSDKGVTSYSFDLYPYGEVQISELWETKDGSSGAVNTNGKSIPDYLNSARADGKATAVPVNISGTDGSAVILQLAMLADGTARAYLVTPTLYTVTYASDGLLVMKDKKGGTKDYSYDSSVPVYDLSGNVWGTGSVSVGDTVVAAYRTDNGTEKLQAVYIARTSVAPTPTPSPSASPSPAP